MKADNINQWFEGQQKAIFNGKNGEWHRERARERKKKRVERTMKIEKILRRRGFYGDEVRRNWGLGIRLFNNGEYYSSDSEPEPEQ